MGNKSSNMTKLESIEKTDAGNVRKIDALRWLNNLPEPEPEEVVEAVTAKKYDAGGSTYASSASEIRISGTPEFVETIAGLLKPMLVYESNKTRLDVSLGQIQDRETNQITDNYHLHLHVEERGPGSQPRTLDAIPDDLNGIISE